MKKSIKNLAASGVITLLIALAPASQAALVVTDSDLVDANTVNFSFDNAVDLVTTGESYGETSIEFNYLAGWDAVVASDGDYFDKVAFTDSNTSVYGFQFNVTNTGGLGWAAYRFEFWNVDSVSGAFTSQITDAAISGAPGLFAPAGTATTEVSPAAVMFTFNSPFNSGTLSGRFDVDLNLLPVNSNSEFGIRQVALLTAADNASDVPVPGSFLLFGVGVLGFFAARKKA